MPTQHLSRLSPTDLLRERLIEAIAISPGGTMVAYSERRVVAGKDRTSLWLVPFAGGRPRRLTHGAWTDGRPRFSPDGRSLAFLSNRDDEDVTQLHVLPLDGGDATRLTSFKRSVTEAEWMPDGRALAVIATDDESHVLHGEREKEAATVRVLRRLDWRMDGDGLLDHPRHVHLVPLSGAAPAADQGRLVGLASCARTPPAARSDSWPTAAATADIDPDTQVHVVDVASRRVRQRSKLPGQVARVLVRRRRHAWSASRSTAGCRCRRTRGGCGGSPPTAPAPA